MPDDIEILNFVLDYKRFSVIKLIIEDEVEPDQVEFIMELIDQLRKDNIIINFKWIETSQYYLSDKMRLIDVAINNRNCLKSANFQINEMVDNRDYYDS